MTDNTSDHGKTTYQAAGVDIHAGNALVERIKPMAQRTQRPEILGGLGAFAAHFKIPSGYQHPVLVAATDGVGTKLKIALETDRHQHIGIDLVAMCVNDLVVSGAEPIAFLDYYATGQLDVDQAAIVIDGIADGCAQAGCALVGGETAEMPGMYQGTDYDLAGFCVGVVEEHRIIQGDQIKPGDHLIGLSSSGPHSNGYSLIRHLIEGAGVAYSDQIDGHVLLDELMAPTRIYVKPLLALLKQFEINTQIKSISHITGGGFYENIPRSLPKGLGAHIQTSAWARPWIFNWLARLANLDHEELYRTFNMGIGVVLCVDAHASQAILNTLTGLGEQACVIGQVTNTPGVCVEP